MKPRLPPLHHWLQPYSPLLHSTHDWKQNSLRYPIPVPLLHHHTSAIITDCNRSTTLSPRLDLPSFLPGTETKREVCLLRTGFGIAPVNKLVSLTWLLWALRSFRSFTLYYSLKYRDNGCCSRSGWADGELVPTCFV